MSLRPETDLALEALSLVLAAHPELTEGVEKVGLVRGIAHSCLMPLRTRMLVEQPFKPRAAALENAGFQLVDAMDGERDLVFLVPERQREQTLADVARAFEVLKPGGWLVTALHNDWGARRLQQYIESVAGPTVCLTKKHCRVFWLRKPQNLHTETLASWAEAGQLRREIEGHWWSKPGLFSWNHIDTGSQLLVDHLPNNLQGTGADLGGGWGFLTAKALEKNAEISSMHLYEADKIAVEAARRNIGNVKVMARTQCRWHDVTQGVEQRRYDFVIMNPPFHEGRAAEPMLGMKFIAAAALALKPEGELWMVANRTLPYEEVLEEAFGSWEKVIEDQGFKVMHASRPQIGARLTRERKGKWRSSR
jgi:16S rRNA (guanine1207-N2)-methyltransferase